MIELKKVRQMVLPKSLHKAVALGTAHSQYNGAHLQGLLNGVVKQIDPQRREARLLLAVAGVQLREQAGYCPPEMAVAPTMPCEKLTTRAVHNQQTIYYLKQMIVAGRYADAMAEWCIHVGLSGQHAPEELVPDLLDYGYAYEIMREYLLMVMGDRARWLARETGHVQWQWALQTRIRKATTLAGDDRWKEPFIIEELYDGTHGILNHPGLRQLATTYYSIWTDTLTDAFLYFVRTRLLARQLGYSVSLVTNLLTQALYQFPLHRAQELLTLLDEWDWQRKHIGALLAFRSDMVAAIYNKHTETVP